MRKTEWSIPDLYLKAHDYAQLSERVHAISIVQHGLEARLRIEIHSLEGDSQRIVEHCLFLYDEPCK